MKALLVAALLAVPSLALAQGWEQYAYPKDGFAVQAPAKPAETHGTYRTAAGATAPTTVYTLASADAVLSVTVADFTGKTVDHEATIAEAAKALAAQGEVSVDETARIDRQYGRHLSLVTKDGARSQISVFFVGDKLYQLEAKALPPNALNATGKTIRFQQSLEFINLGAEQFRPENRPQGAGPPRGEGGRPPRPPPQAFTDCAALAIGAAVQHHTPQGVVPAHCVQTPEGLAARPDMPLRDGPPRG
jgi:hypothetical protein